MNKNILILVVGIVALGGGFFGGMKYQESKTPIFTRQFGNIPGGVGRGTGQGQAGGNRFQGGFRPINGEILSQDDKSITVKLSDGSSKIVLFSDTTTLNKAEQAKKEELKNGETVAVFGSENSDGTITAQSIQLNPVMRLPQPSATPKS
jgi:hypothetical protein